MYLRLSKEAAKDYDKVKFALMKRYDLTEDGCRRKFRASQPKGHLAKIAKIADQVLEAHGKHLLSPGSRKPPVQLERDEAKNMQSNQTAPRCFKCNTRGHRAVNCQTIATKCFLCGKQQHEARNCCLGGRDQEDKVRMVTLPVQRGQVSASCLVQPTDVKPTL